LQTAEALAHGFCYHEDPGALASAEAPDYSGWLGYRLAAGGGILC